MPRFERGNHVGEKASGIIVAGVQRKPGDRQMPLLNPTAEQRGLAEASGRGDQRELAFSAFVQPLRQPRPCNPVGAWRRYEAFGGEHWIVLCACASAIRLRGCVRHVTLRFYTSRVCWYSMRSRPSIEPDRHLLARQGVIGSL